MIESTGDSFSDMNSMEAELEQNERLSLELLQLKVNEASKCSKMKIFNFQGVVWENCSKLEINSLHNLRATIKYYVLTQYATR